MAMSKQRRALAAALEALDRADMNGLPGLTPAYIAIGEALAELEQFTAVEPAQSDAEPAAWKHDCAALLTNGVELWIDACPHCGKPRTAAVEPAQAVPAFWASENILRESLRDNISCVLTTTKCAANTVPLYTAPPAIDETQQRALDFVRWIASLKTGGLIQARANDILKLLEADNE